MKIILLFLLCVFVSFNTFGQSETDENSRELTVEEISLARDDGSGQAGEIAENFTTTDVPIYCLISLSSTKSVIVKMNLVAVSARAIKPGTVVVTLSYKTNGNQNRVWFKASPDGVWTVGKYRVDVLLDGKTSGSREFEIKKNAGKAADEKTGSAKKSPKPKTAKRVRRN